MSAGEPISFAPANRSDTNYSPRLPRFDRTRLPEPLEYFASQSLKLIGSGAWRSAICPFHKDTCPSLRVSVTSGGYRCFACGASGGDVLAFQMRRYGQGFVAAAKALGAWGAQ
jgi:hypothetical protein